MLSALLLGNTLVNVMFSTAMATIALSVLRNSRTLWTLLQPRRTVLVSHFRRICPKRGERRRRKAVIAVSPVLKVLDLVMKPFSHTPERAASWFARAIHTSRAGQRSLPRTAPGHSGLRRDFRTIRNDEAEMI